MMKMRGINKGFMAVEAVVAVGIILVSVLVAMSVTDSSVRVSRLALHDTEAAYLLEEGAEAVRTIRDNSWDGIANLATGTSYYPEFSGSWSLSPTPSTVGIFTRAVSVAAVNRNSSTDDISASGTDDPGTRLVNVSVSWLEGGQVRTKNLSFYIMDIFS